MSESKVRRIAGRDICRLTPPERQYAEGDSAESTKLAVMGGEEGDFGNVDTSFFPHIPKSLPIS